MNKKTAVQTPAKTGTKTKVKLTKKMPKPSVRTWFAEYPLSTNQSPKEQAFCRVYNFYNMLEACKKAGDAVNLMAQKELNLKTKIAEMKSTGAVFTSNVENVMANSNSANMTNLMATNTYNDVFAKWFVDVKREFETVMNSDENAVKAINLAF